jgi:hypothetical protein
MNENKSLKQRIPDYQKRRCRDEQERAIKPNAANS